MYLDKQAILELQKEIHSDVMTLYEIPEREADLLGHHTRCLLKVAKECVTEHLLLVCEDEDTVPTKERISKTLIALSYMFHRALSAKESE